MSTITSFTTSGSWTCPEYVTTVWARCWGGGGSAGGITATPSSFLSGGGGAGGSFSEKVAYPVTPGNHYTVTVGGIKTGSTGSGSVGNDSWFDNNTTGVLAKGGAGGSSPAVDGATGLGGGGSTTGCIGDNKFAGGTGANGLSGNTSSFVGSGGGGAGSGAAGGPGSGLSGGGGGSASGGSGGNGRSTAGAGAAGSSAGGGGGAALGSAASHSFSGGSGAAGRVELEFTPGSISAGGNIRAVVDVAVDVTAAPATFMGLVPVSGDNYLLIGNVGRNNGVWTFSSVGSAMTEITSDADGTFRDVGEGTRAGARVFVSSVAFADPTLIFTDFASLSSANTFFINPAAPSQVGSQPPSAFAPGGYVTVCPAVTSGNPWVVTHGLHSQFVICAIALTTTPFDFVRIGPLDWDVQRTDLYSVTVIPPITITAGAYEIIVTKSGF